MKVTKRQLRRIIKEERAKLNESVPARRRKDYERMKQRPLNDLMNSIDSLIVYIEGQLMSPGSFDYEDVFDWDFGHVARLADLIDAAREKAAEEGVPFREPDTSEIAQYQHRGKPAVVSRWSMNEGIMRGKMNEALDPGTPEYDGAVDDLFNDFRNSIAIAKDAGLLQEDIDDAYRDAVAYIRTMT